MWRWLEILLNMWRETKTEPKPEPKPEPVEQTDDGAVGWRIRLKDYHNSPNREHKGRRTSVKLDTRFHTQGGMDESNTKVIVDGLAFTYYGVDAENGKHDLCFADGIRFPEDYNEPCYLKVYKDEVLYASVKITKWLYGTVHVTKEG